MSFTPPSFDTLLDEVLTDWRNQFPGADTSQGSLIFIRSACLASALWGLYHHQEWVSRQYFPDTADTDALEHHAWVRGLSRESGETDTHLLDRLLDIIRKPPAGGNQYDYARWAVEVDNVEKGYSFPLAQGLASVDVVIIADRDATGSVVASSHAMSGTNTEVAEGTLIDGAADFLAAEDPVRPGDVVRNTTADTQATVTTVDSATQLTLSSDVFLSSGQEYAIDALTVQVYDYIEEERPVGFNLLRVLPATAIEQDVTMTVTGSSADIDMIEADVAAYIEGLALGETLYLSQLIAIAIGNGASNVVITAPAADVVADEYEIVIVGEISVTRA
jgi:uncharacterized phage protein gp47/JayE